MTETKELQDALKRLADFNDKEFKELNNTDKSTTSDKIFSSFSEYYSVRNGTHWKGWKYI